jgi:hypothetical protein
VDLALAQEKDRLWWTRQLNFEFHIRRLISLLTERLPASSFMEQVQFSGIQCCSSKKREKFSVWSTYRIWGSIPCTNGTRDSVLLQWVLPFKLWIPTKMTVFWDAAPCSLVETDRCFIGAYCFHHLGATSHFHTRCRENLKSHCGLPP